LLAAPPPNNGKNFSTILVFYSLSWFYHTCEFGCYHYHPLQKEPCPQGLACQVAESDWGVGLKQDEGRVVHAEVGKWNLMEEWCPAVSQDPERVVQMKIWLKCLVDPTEVSCVG
jgi:hypothetical protein